MKVPDLMFLLDLSKRIDRGASILETDRENFMAHFVRFLNAVSLGMDLGLKMKAKGATSPVTAKPSSSAKPTKGAKPTSDAKGKRFFKQGRPAMINQTMQKLLKKKPMSMSELMVKLKPILAGSKDPKGYLHSYIHHCDDFESVPNQRGFYRLAKKHGKSNGKSNGKKNGKAGKAVTEATRKVASAATAN